MGFISSVFSLTQFVSSGAELGINAGLNYVNRLDPTGQLKFIHPKGYENVIVYAAKRTMMQIAFAKINDLYPAYVRQLDNKRLTAAYKKNQGSQMKQIIGDTTEADEASLQKQKATISYMGKPAPEALLLWIGNGSDKMTNIAVQTYWDKVKTLSQEEAAGAKTIVNTKIEVAADEDKVFWDLGPMVQVQSSNNVVLTKVQGRDFSRKELISGGDVNFTVTGKIVSNYPDVYPYALVSKFITLMQHPGVLHVSNLMFQQFNVTQVLIKDFQMGQNEGFKNVQPYSFTCVGIEPNDAVQVVEDTIQATNLSIAKMKKKGWATKLLEQVKAAAANQAAQMVTQLTANTI